MILKLKLDVKYKLNFVEILSIDKHGYKNKILEIFLFIQSGVRF